MYQEKLEVILSTSKNLLFKKNKLKQKKKLKLDLKLIVQVLKLEPFLDIIKV